MKTIKMDSVVGSDTLCAAPIVYGLFALGEAGYDWNFSEGEEVSIAESVWQSTVNNLVIPDGLVCDIQYICERVGLRLKYDVPSHSLFTYGNKLTAVRVSRKQHGYRYEWTSES